ncbi:MAG: PAS domain S-box protein [Blautia sp.]|nr:PAS domain S-box protein [Blautia sp.]
MSVTSEQNRQHIMQNILLNIMQNMKEGIMTIGFDGTITYANPAVHTILGFPEGMLTGRIFASLFFQNSENDAFSQMVLDAIYSRSLSHEEVIPYTIDHNIKHLRVVSSFLSEEGKHIGVILVIGDLSELMALRDAVSYMEQIQALNTRLEMRNKLLEETFGRFLSDEIVRQLLETPNGLALGGKKQNLTIMMSDLRGFTALSEQMDAADLLCLLNHYLGEMTEVIQNRNGTIIEFIGDGILAIFGAPLPDDAHAVHAVAAALEMQTRMADINRWNTERNYPSLQMGIGIHTGEVIVGNIGSEKRTKYGVAGSHVNLCGRIESYTVGGQILISSDVRRELSASLEAANSLEVAKEMTVFPKGSQSPLELSDVIGIGAPYNLSIPAATLSPAYFSKPVPVCFYKLDGKRGLAERFYAGLAASGMNSGILDTQTHLELFDNIQIDADGKLYAKIMEKKPDGYLIQYTSVPENFKAWLSNIRK